MSCGGELLLTRARSPRPCSLALAWQGHNSAEGPTIAGCRVLWGSLVLKFDESLLSGETVVLQPPRYAEGSMLQVLVDDSQFCLQRMVTCNASFSSSGACRARRHAPPPA